MKACEKLYLNRKARQGREGIFKTFAFFALFAVNFSLRDRES